MTDSAVIDFEKYLHFEIKNSKSEPAPRKVIQLQAGRLHLYAAEAEQVISNFIYVRGQSLVRIGLPKELPESSQNTLQRSDNAAVIVEVNPEYLRRRVNTLAEFQKYSRMRGQWEPIDCPRDLACNILGAGDWEYFQPLDSISTAPFLRRDFSICATPGYDPESRVFYAPNATFPPIPERPTKDDAAAAMTRIIFPFRQFPFATDAARAAFLSNFIEHAARNATDTRPITIYSAPTAGTGKTLLARCISLAVNGVMPAVRPYSSDSEEMRKVLLTALLAGDPMLHLDNVPSGSKIRSPVLCGFLTADVYSDRKLGVSESPSLPNRCDVVATGNNITATGDLARRAIVVRLDVNAETTRGREFEIGDLPSYIREHRPQLLVDALTIIRAYTRASDPVQLPPLPSFETWSQVARDPVAWLGYGDAVDSQELETDDEVAPLRAAFTGLADAWACGEKDFLARDIAKLCGGFDGDALKSTIESAGCSDACDARHIGYWLRANRDKVAADLKLVQLGTTDGSSRWRIKHV